MIRLLLETATDVCSVAVAKAGVILAEHTATEVHQHSSHLTLFIQQVMAEAGLALSELDEIVLSDGPGSYTSLRVGAATAKGLCVALPGLRLRVVPTLTALAGAAKTDKDVTLATINSRRGEVYGQLFLARPQGQEKVEEAKKEDLWKSPQNIRTQEEGWYDRLLAATGTEDFTVVGPGQALLLGDEAANHPLSCSAIHLLAPASAPETSRLVDVATYEPCYLNAPFVTKSKKKLLGR